jgi:hypothetical protein
MTLDLHQRNTQPHGTKPPETWTDQGGREIMAQWDDYFISGHGASQQRFNTGNMQTDRNSTLLASICEVDNNNYPMNGTATMRIHNIVPLDGGTTVVYVEIIWESDLRARVRVIKV